jgi:DNA-binding beta-propeller fold protein YncE
MTRMKVSRATAPRAPIGRWRASGLAKFATLLVLAAAGARVGALESWISALSGREVVAIDPATGAVAARTDLGRADADGIYPTPGGKAVFITHSEAPIFTVLDGETHKVRHTITVEAGIPAGIWFAPDGDPAYVSIRGSSIVVVNEHRAGRLVPAQRLDAGGTDPSIAFNRRGTRFYRADPGGVAFFLESSRNRFATVETAAATHWSFAPDFRFLWGIRDGGFVVVDEQGRRQAADRLLPVLPRAPAFSENGQSVWFVAKDGGSVYRVSARNFALVRQAGLPGRAEAIVVAGNEPWVYAPEAGALWRLDPNDGALRTTIALPGGPAPAGPRSGREIAVSVLRPNEGFACF